MSLYQEVVLVLLVMLVVATVLGIWGQVCGLFAFRSALTLLVLLFATLVVQRVQIVSHN